jgi:hypothetical protein
MYNAPVMAKRKKPRFTKLHELLLFVFAPPILMGVLEVIWHPPVWVFFLVGVPCAAAVVHLLWPLIPTGPAKAGHLFHIFFLSALVVVYTMAASKAQVLQNSKRLEQEKADVFAKLRFLLPQTRGVDATNTAFKVVNDSEHALFAEPLVCGHSDSVIRFRHLIINGGSSYLDKQTTRVERGGDVQSTTCLQPITLAMGLPDYSILCADVRVHLNYYLDEDPLTMQTKVRRFLGAPTSNGFSWQEIPVNAPGSACK